MTGPELRLLGGAEQAVIVTDADRRITFWNLAAEKLYGWTSDEVLGRNVIDVTTIDAAEGLRVLEPVEAGASWAGEFKVRRKSGERFPAFVTISPLRDPDGRPAGVIGLSFQVAPRAAPSPAAPPPSLDAQLAPAVAGSLRELGVRGEVAVAVGLAGLAGVLRGAIGLALPDAVPFAPFFPAVLVASLVGSWRGGAIAVAVSVLLAWGMSQLPRPLIGFDHLGWDLVQFVAMSLVVVAVGAYGRRLVERLDLARRELAESQLRFNAVHDAMSEGFALCEAILDSNGDVTDYVILEMNPALQKMLGVGPEAIGTRLSDGAGGSNRRWLELCSRVMRTGRPEGFEYHNTTMDRWYEIRLSRVDEKRMSQLFFDVTARKEAEAHQARLLDELNHRVRNNLTIVSGLLQMQSRTASPEARDHLLRAVSRVNSIAQVHGALYKGARRKDVEFSDYLRDLCASLAQSLVNDERITFEVSAEPLALPIDAAIPLGMIVNELVTNAVKYAYPEPESGVVSVRCSQDADGLLLSVGDSGGGLPAAPRGPTGSIGTRLVQSLVEQLGGKLTVRQHPGATFDIRVPAASIQPASDEQNLL